MAIKSYIKIIKKLKELRNKKETLTEEEYLEELILLKEELIEILDDPEINYQQQIVFNDLIRTLNTAN